MLLPVSVFAMSNVCYIGFYDFIEILVLQHVCIPNHRCYEFSKFSTRRLTFPEYCVHAHTRRIDSYYLHIGCTTVPRPRETVFHLYRHGHIYCFDRNNRKLPVHGSTDHYVVYNPNTKSVFALSQFYIDCMFKNKCIDSNNWVTVKHDILYVSYYEYSYMYTVFDALDRGSHYTHFPPQAVVDVPHTQAVNHKQYRYFRTGKNCHITYACIDIHKSDYLDQYNPSYCACKKWDDLSYSKLSSMVLNSTGFVLPCLVCAL